jgi:N-methylhydantoinase A
MNLIGVDIGGTFTDIMLANTIERRTYVHKVPTTADDPSLGMIRGISEICRSAGVSAGEIDHLLHGTTIATNVMLENDGAKTGMITTQGYRDIIHIARHQRPQHYSIMQDVPWQDRPLVRRRHRKTVPERLAPSAGEVEIPLDEEAVRRAVRELKREGVDSIAVCFLFSYLNPVHEERVEQIIREEYPEAFVTTSASVFPQFREFERFTTASINAFVGPKVHAYIGNLQTALRGEGVEARLHIMRSNGGVATSESAREKPVTLLLSGPAAGVLGGAWEGRASGRDHLITFDVGGTSADIGIVTPRGFVEASARDTWVAGFPVMVPMIDVHTIGAGGGSIAYVDPGGAFRVGPKSAGSDPGPACYGRYPDPALAKPTVTDAHIVLGRLSPKFFLGGEMPLYAELASAAIGRLAGELETEVVDAAEGVLRIINHNMAAAIRSRTVQKGHDPRNFSLVAFGGAGPLHAAEVADILGIGEVLVPMYPGLTSALGLLTTDLKYDVIRTEFTLNTSVDPAVLDRHFEELEEEVHKQLLDDGVPSESIEVFRYADCRYSGQGYELRVGVSGGTLTEAALTSAWNAFHELHRVEYGHAFPEAPIELVNVRVVGIGGMPKLAHLPFSPGTSLQDALLEEARGFFQQDGRVEESSTTYYDRHRLPVSMPIVGPAVAFQKDATTVIPPGWQAQADEVGNLVLTRARAEQKEKRR